MASRPTLGSPSPEGLIGVQVPAGESAVRIVFENTPVRATGETISLAALLIVLALLAVAWARVPRRGGSIRWPAVSRRRWLPAWGCWRRSWR